jgi:hypothetical protein
MADMGRMMVKAIKKNGKILHICEECGICP